MDTTRADRCSVTGGPTPTTPGLERLAADGVRYTEAWSPGGWTVPAHASLFTGLRQDRHKVELGLRLHLDRSIPTLASLLRAAGWRTAGFSNNDLVGPSIGLDRGFERFDALFRDATRPKPWCDATHAAALEWALGVHRRGERFLLFVNQMEPHLPYDPPEPFARRFLPADATPAEVAWGRRFDFPETLQVLAGRRTLTPRERTILTALYDAEIALLDDSIDRFLGSLREEGVLDRTLVVVCGDHGENLGDHGLVDHRFSLHRSIRHVPLVIRLPGAFDGGRTVRDVVRLEDVAPTVLDVCGVPAPPRLDGVSLVGRTAGRTSPAMLGPPGDFHDRMRDFVPGIDVRPFAASWRAVFDGTHHVLAASDGRTEAYDLTADPREERDLAPADGPLVERLRRALEGPGQR